VVEAGNNIGVGVSRWGTSDEADENGALGQIEPIVEDEDSILGLLTVEDGKAQGLFDEKAQSESPCLQRRTLRSPQPEVHCKHTFDSIGYCAPAMITISIHGTFL